MRWRKLPAWLKGGIISTITLFIPLVVLQIYYRNTWEILGSSLTFEIYRLLNRIPLIFNPTNQTIKLILAFVIYFVIGAVIGLIVGKTKSKK